MIAKLVAHKARNSKMDQNRTPQTKGATINNESITAESAPLNGHKPKPLGGEGEGLKYIFWYQILARDLVNFKTQTKC